LPELKLGPTYDVDEINCPAVTGADPIEEFHAVLARASDAAPYDPVAVTLATADSSGRPSARIVLLRGVDERGFLFYTNYQSRKAAELDDNPFAALCCYWPWLEEQVRVEGRVERVSGAESDEYFDGRPRGSQIGAWASDQSRPLPDRATLEARYESLQAQFGEAPVPRPDHWGGYRIRPDRIEFWKAGTYRLHQRHLYVRDGAAWRVELLYP
jgi:pyridoxamine 5'-phosphate oxidase